MPLQYAECTAPVFSLSLDTEQTAALSHLCQMCIFSRLFRGTIGSCASLTAFVTCPPPSLGFSYESICRAYTIFEVNPINSLILRHRRASLTLWEPICMAEVARDRPLPPSKWGMRHMYASQLLSRRSQTWGELLKLFAMQLVRIKALA